MQQGRTRKFPRFLDPVDRVSEVLFGLIMVLTITGTLSVLTAGHAEIRTMIIAALGCNIAWGIIDAGIHLMGALREHAQGVLMLRAAQDGEVSEAAARRTIAASLPDPVAAALSPDELEAIRRKLLRLPPPQRPRLTKEDWLGAASVCFWVILSTFPVVIPFFFIGDVVTALRASNAVALLLLFICGYLFARSTGQHPWLTGLLMIGIGCALVAIAIALGG